MNIKEVADALGCLQDNGLPVNISDGLKKQLDQQFLFDGDDHIFKKMVEASQSYGEYGCGKSTLWVGRNFLSTLKHSVDTNVQWATRVNAQLGANVVEYIDVGDVGDWGRPKNLQRRKNFILYAESLWDKDVGYDTVLIDGRFRVLCFLTSLLRCGTGTTILFDDYRDRPHYHVVEEFVKPVDFCGRQAVFRIEDKSDIDLVAVDEERARFAYIIE